MTERSNKPPAPQAGQDALLAAVLAFQQGDRDAFERMYDPLWQAARLRAGRMGLGHADAEEIAQKVLVRVYLYAARATFTAVRELWGWVYTIIAREVYKHWRRKRPDLFAADALELHLGRRVSPDDDPADATVESEMIEHVGDCIGRLGDEERLYVLGPLVEGLTFRKAAALHGLTLGKFKHRYQKAMERIRDCMRRKGHDL